MPGGQSSSGDAPLAVLDARGEGLFTLVFAGDAPAVCRAAMADPDAAAGRRRPGDRRWRGARGGAGAPRRPRPGGRRRGDAGRGNVLVGRVGDGVPEVSVNHDDATWTKASIGNGWYAVWWPLAKEAIGVAAVDRRNTVIDSYAP